MNALSKLIVAVGCALPLIAVAQTPASPNVKPADQPRTALEKEQTTHTGQATQYPGPGTDSGAAMSKDDTTHGAAMKHKGMKDKAKATDAAPGSAPATTTK